MILSVARFFVLFQKRLNSTSWNTSLLWTFVWGRPRWCCRTTWFCCWVLSLFICGKNSHFFHTCLQRFHSTVYCYHFIAIQISHVQMKRTNLCVTHGSCHNLSVLGQKWAEYAFEHPCQRFQKNSSIMTEFCSVISVSHTAEVAMVTHPLSFWTAWLRQKIRNRTFYFRTQTCEWW